MVADLAPGNAYLVQDESTLERVMQHIRRTSSQAPFAVLCTDQATEDRARTLLHDRGRDAVFQQVDQSDLQTVVKAVADIGVTTVYVAADATLPTTDLKTRLSTAGVAVRELEARERRKRVLLQRASGRKTRVLLFGLAFSFYLLLGELVIFDIVTGAASAAVTVLLLGRITFDRSPKLGRLVRRVLRAVLFLPYLFWEILKSNVALAAVLLRPRLPIDQSFVTVETEADSDLERALLANSITLTPGTLAVDVDESTVKVHTLTEGSRVGLASGSLERAVQFVFHGRRTERAEDADR